MILTDREIAIALGCGQLVIDPAPRSFTSTSVDLTVESYGLIWEVPGGVRVYPGDASYKFSDIVKSFQKSKPIKELVLKPSNFILSWTRETIELPVNSKLAARVEGRSSLARLGIGIHVTAPTIHSGFRGRIQLELCNFGPFEIGLEPGMKICQIIIEQTVGTAQAGYVGQFLDQQV
jgi:dCTP deaminase